MIRDSRKFASSYNSDNAEIRNERDIFEDYVLIDTEMNLKYSVYGKFNYREGSCWRRIAV